MKIEILERGGYKAAKRIKTIRKNVIDTGVFTLLFSNKFRKYGNEKRNEQATIEENKIANLVPSLFA